MSSFRKSTSSVTPSAQQGSGRRSGVKPWINGLQLVSSGNNDLDEVLGGGIVLGSMTLLLEDEHSNYAETLMLYSIAESISRGHKVLVLSPDTKLMENQLLGKLPLNINAERAGVEAETAVPTTGAEEHLKIAWQYSKYMQQAPSSKNSSFCCSYDLNDKLQATVISAAPPIFHRIDTSDASHLITAKETIRSFLQSCQSSNEVPKVYLCRLGEESNSSSCIARTLLSLKHTCRNFGASITVTLRPSLVEYELLYRADAVSDCVLSVESFAGRAHCVPVEFRYFCGFLNVLKLQQMSSLAPHRSSAARYGLKRNRRKLCIEQLHLPPEESRAVRSDTEKMKASASSTTSAPSASTVICNTKSASAYDF